MHCKSLQIQLLDLFDPAGETELWGSATEAGGGAYGIKPHPSQRDQQGDERMAAWKPGSHQGTAEAQRPSHWGGEDCKFLALIQVNDQNGK